jgi:DNA invertase Pin-like site-specific DNA recombinase
MGRVWGYIRENSDQRRVKDQELAILNYCGFHELHVDEWYTVGLASRKTIKRGFIDDLIQILQAGDTLVVSEMSRLARSVGQIAVLVGKLLEKGVRVVSIKESMDLNGRRDMKTEVMIAMFDLFAEMESDLISERTKEGLKRAREQGKVLGRPKGSLGKSVLDGKEDKIRALLDKKVSKASIAKIFGVSWAAADNFIRTRELG